MKKVLLLATAALLFSGVSFAGNTHKGKKKKCGKSKTCCSKTTTCCKKDKAKTASL